MRLPVFNVEGREVRTLEVDDSVFGITPNVPVLHQAYVAQRNNQRWGTAQTKTRGEVAGSTRKIRMQKYTGRARQGSIRAPHHVGGGIVFGPRQRDYSQALPKKMRRLAIRSALSGKVADGQLVVVDQLALERPKTKEIQRVLQNVGIRRSALIVTGRPDRTVLVSARNLEKTKVLPAAYLNVVDMMDHAGLLMTEEAVRVAESLWGRKAAPSAAPEAPTKAAARPRTKAKAAAEAEAEAKEAEVTAEAAQVRPRTRARRAVAEAPPEAEAAAETPKRQTRRKAPAGAETPEARGEEKPRRRTRKMEEGEA